MNEIRLWNSPAGRLHRAGEAVFCFLVLWGIRGRAEPRRADAMRRTYRQEINYTPDFVCRSNQPYSSGSEYAGIVDAWPTDDGQPGGVGASS